MSNLLIRSVSGSAQTTSSTSSLRSAAWALALAKHRYLWRRSPTGALERCVAHARKHE